MSVSIEQLWSEKIYHNMPWVPGCKIPKKFRHKYISISPIKWHIDRSTDGVKEYDWGDRLKDSFYRYKRYAATTNPWWKPQLDSKFDEVRYWFHLKLLQWKIIV